MSTPQNTKAKRPLSPHLQVYRLPYNARMSIIGRGVGIILSVAVSVILAWFVAVVWNPAFYDVTMQFLSKPVIDVGFRYLLLAGAFVTFFYLGNGIRHVLWDLVIGVNVKFGVMTGKIVLVVSALLTFGLWLIGSQYWASESIPLEVAAELAEAQVEGGNDVE